MQGRSVDEYRAPLFVAWQLTNRCTARCVACCEESGPGNGWPDELGREAALAIAGQIASSGVPYVAYGGGEPLGVSWCWDLFQVIADAGVLQKLETDGSRIDDVAADRLAALRMQCIQISVDGATAATHERCRPGSSFAAATGAIARLTARGLTPQWVFVPTRLNLHEMPDAYERAASMGCEAFVTGPLMRIGRAAVHWDALACSASEWDDAVAALRERAGRIAAPMALSIYPWDIVTEMERRLESPQAMLLVVPNGKVKLLNALPFAPADLRRDSLDEAWDAYRRAWQAPQVRAFIRDCRGNPALLRHANETWPVDAIRIAS